MTYHSSWPYFAEAFGFTIVAKVEPFPGIPPTGNHLAELVSIIKRDNVRFILQEPYFSDDAPKFLNRQTGIKVFKCSPSFFGHFDAIVTQLAALQGGK